MTRARLTPEERRERARLRSERWRRAQARQEAALTQAVAAREAVFDRLQWQIAELRASLDRCAVAHAVMARELWISS